MALIKEIELENGIPVKYHRIVSLNKITNQTNLIEIASYTSEKQRQKEVDYYETQQESDMNVYIHTTFLNKEYNELETISDAYEYLKSTELFKDAKDI